jgi:hypothetical protein
MNKDFWVVYLSGGIVTAILAFAISLLNFVEPKLVFLVMIIILVIAILAVERS